MEKSAFIIYLFVLALSPVLFGAVHTWVYTLVFILIILAHFLLVKQSIVKTDQGIYAYRIPKTGMLPLFLLFILFLAFQMILLPKDLVSMVSPEAKIVEGFSMPAASLAVTGGAIVLDQWSTLAPYVYPVRMSLIRWIIYGLLFYGLVRTLNSRKRIKTVVLLILCVATAESLYGIIDAYSGSGRMLWAKRILEPDVVAGTYENRNHFAGLMEMGIVLAAAYAGTRAISGTSKTRRSSRKDEWKKKIMAFFSRKGLLVRRFPLIFSGVIMGTGLVLSRSRGGIIAMAASLLVMGLFFVFHKDHRRKGTIVLSLFLLISVYSLTSGIDKTVDRFRIMDISYQQGRSLYARNTMKMFDDYRITGVGIGNFKYAYPRYQDHKLKQLSVIYTHNDWIQFLAEAGIAGFILMLAGLGYYFYPIIRKCLTRHSSFAVCLGIGSLAAAAAMAIHSLSDFNLRIPANFMILTAILAIGFCALHLEEGRHRDNMTYGYWSLPLWRGGVIVLGAMILVMLWTGGWLIRNFVAEIYCPIQANPTLNLNMLPSEDRIRRAITWDCENASYYYKLALVLTRKEDRGIQQTMQMPGSNETEKATGQDENKKAIISALEEAIRLNPLDAEYHVRLAWEFTHLWYRPDYMKKWMPAADRSMERAAHVAGDWAENPHLHIDMGNYWVMRSRSLPPEDPATEAAWIKAIWHYHKALAVNSGRPADSEDINGEENIAAINAKAVESAREEIAQFVKNFYPEEARIREAIEEGKE